MPITDSYLLAGLTVRVSSLWPEVHALCRDYRTEGTADIAVEIAQADIDFERERSARSDAASAQRPDAYLETLAVYRKIAERLPEHGRLLVHGSCVAVDGAGYLFLAKSGTGKSTHARLWRETLGPRAVMINDDKPLLSVEGAGARVYGTPWDGKHRLSTNTSVPLRALCILERAAQNSIRPVTPGEAYPVLLRQVYRPLERAAMERTLPLIDALSSSVSLWRLGCNMDPEAAQIAYDAMKGP